MTSTVAPGPIRPCPEDEPAAPSALLVGGAIALTLTLWASAFVAIRHLGHEMSPGALSLGRLAVAAIALCGFLFSRTRRLPPRSTWGWLLLGGVAWFAVYNLALNDAERRIDAGTAALLVQVGPLLVAIFATVLLGERLTGWLVLGLAIGFGGVVIVAEATNRHGGGDLLGVLLAVLAAVGYAIGVISQKKALAHLSALEVTTWFTTVGAVCCLPWAGALVDAVATHPEHAGWVLYLGLFPSAVAFTTMAFAMQHADASRVSMTTFLVPFLTTLIAWLTLGEVPPGLAFVGGALCIAGVLIARRRPRAATA